MDELSGGSCGWTMDGTMDELSGGNCGWTINGTVDELSNSMEALILLVAETGAYDLVWSIGYIIMNLQFRKQRLLWIEDNLCA